MEKKSFLIFLSILVTTFLLVSAIKHYRPVSKLPVALDSVPLQEGEWQGRPASVTPSVMKLLCPDALFSAFYTDQAGNTVQLFIDYYSPQNASGAIHSPRNCLPGSGWIIAGSSPQIIDAGNRKIPANRFLLQLEGSREVMDFWYITRYGETANDFRLKLDAMVSSLTLKPTDKAFVRFITSDDPKSISAMEKFEVLFVDKIYQHLPF